MVERMGAGQFHLRRMGAAVRNITPQHGSQLLAVVGEDLRVVCAARNGNVGHAVVEQVFGPQLGIGVDQHTVGGLPLPGMTRHGVASAPSIRRTLPDGWDQPPPRLTLPSEQNRAQLDPVPLFLSSPQISLPSQNPTKQTATPQRKSAQPCRELSPKSAQSK